MNEAEMNMLHLQQNNRRGVMIAAAVVLLLGHASANAQASFDEEFDDTGKTWQEIAIHLPAMPDMANLLPFDVSATATQTFSVAPDSLSVGADGVIRYVMVARSDSGALNVSYQGLRCTSGHARAMTLGSLSAAMPPIGAMLLWRRIIFVAAAPLPAKPAISSDA